MRDGNRLVVGQWRLPRRLRVLGDAGEALQLVAPRERGQIAAIVFEPGKAVLRVRCRVGGAVGGQGQLELTGGTGVYVGLAGRCTYETEYLANNQVITTTDCTWHRE